MQSNAFSMFQSNFFINFQDNIFSLKTLTKSKIEKSLRINMKLSDCK